jgi:hypothetical protein
MALIKPLESLNVVVSLNSDQLKILYHLKKQLFGGRCDIQEFIGHLMLHVCTCPEQILKVAEKFRKYLNDEDILDGQQSLDCLHDRIKSAAKRI